MDLLVAITAHVKENMSRKHGLKISRVIPVGVDTKNFLPADRPERARLVVLSVGTFIERKMAHIVLEAARRYRDVHFRLVGEKRGNYILTLQCMAEKWKLENVSFHSPVSQTELAVVMNSSDIMIHPSKDEGLPKVVLEAAATGLPSIILDSYRAPVVVDRETGFQVRTSGEMLERLGELIRDRGLRRRMGEAAVEHARQFDWEMVVKQWEEAFRSLYLSSC
jgi:glycosyltransferase involved in cell wall biosynthesis